MAVPFLTFIAREAVYQLTQKIVGVNLVNRNYEKEVASKGQTITILTPEAVTTQAAGAAFSAVDVNPGTNDLVLSNWQETKPLKISQKTYSLSETNWAEMYAEPIANALASNVEIDLFAIFNTFTNTVGVVATAPTGLGPLGSDLKSKFDGMLVVPDMGRMIILAPTAEGSFHATFGLYNTSGNTGEVQQTTGQLPSKFGMSYYGSPNVLSTIAGYGFHKNAVVMASRPIQVSNVALQGTQVSVEYKGLGLTVEHWHDYQTSADYLRAQILYGFKKLNENGFKILK